jgi:hypothetical protein
MMGFEDASQVDLVAVLVALLSLWVAVRALNRTKASDLYALRQNVLLKAEVARSAWYKLNHENNSLIQRVRLCSSSDSPETALMIEFLNTQRDHLDLCIRGAVALAEDVRMNVDTFNEKKCRDYLRLIDPSIEKLTRNQGVAERKVSDFLERLSATTA